MDRRHVELWAPALEASGVLLAYGHWGRPVLVFPTEGGRRGSTRPAAW
jgi:esterase/lipase superfamily enzyme